jgi:hypothetical protein
MLSYLLCKKIARRLIATQLQLVDVRLVHDRRAEQHLAVLVLRVDDVLEAVLEALADARGLVEGLSCSWRVIGIFL